MRSSRKPKSRSSWSPTPLEQRLMLAADAGAAVDSGQDPVAATDGAAASTRTHVDRIVFVDASVEELAMADPAVAADAELVLLDAERDGLQQITEHLRTRRDVSEVHVVSHAAAGKLKLGNAELSAANLKDQATRISSWGEAFNAETDLLFYGCDLAADASGRELVRSIAKLCGADVAASTDRTGNAAQHGDWQLEYHVGDVNAGIALSRAATDGYTGHLAIEINAAGTTGDEIMELLIDDQVAATFNVGAGAENGQFQSYFASIDGVDVNRIGVRFANDLYLPDQGIDRNLRVNWIRVDGVQYETEAPSVFSDGTFVEGVGIQGGNWQSEYLHSGGTFQYASQQQGSLIEIVARGETGDESMELRIDGSPVQIFTSVSQSSTTYSFQADRSVSADQIQVAFINSFYAPEVDYDQNLYIDLIRIDGVTYQTEDPSTFSTGTWNPGTGIVPGNYQTEILHADGYFQYGGGGSQQSTSIAFSSDNFIVREDVGSAGLTVVRSGDLSQASSVDYFVQGGFAVAGQDYQSVSGRLDFAAGESSKTFTVPILNDGTPEGTETFTVELSNPSGAQLGVERTTIVTINDDDNVNPPGSLNVQVPSGFNVQRIAGDVNFAGPTALKVANDGRVFVVEKFGSVYVVENGQRVDTPFLDLTSEVYSVGTSQGLAGFALDPNFDSNGYVYVLYTASENGVRFGRLERYTVNSFNRNQVDPNSRRILIGNNASDGFPDGGDIHLVGDLKFGNDGSLLISYGDAAGNNNISAAFNAQNLDNLGGVIARVNPANGQGYASNPFYTGDPNDVRSKIWAYGLRNPYRFEVADDGSTNPNDGNPGTLYIGDVMFMNSEELNIARGGENFGWPYYEGFNRFTGTPPAQNYTFPEVAYARSDARTSIAGAIIGESGFPNGFSGDYLHADFTNGWIRAYNRDAQGNLDDGRGFATGAFGITDLEWDPTTGQLYFVALNQAAGFRGELYAINYSETSSGGFSPSEVSTGTDGVAFAITASEEVFRRDGNAWTQLPGNYKKISVRNASEVWAIDSFGNAARWDGSVWQDVGGPALNDIAVSPGGDVWAVNTANIVLQRVGNDWVTIGGTLTDIEVDGNGNVIGVNPAGQIWQRIGGGWSRISGTLVDISIGTDGSIWGTNAANQVWRRVGNTWQLDSSVSLRTISVNNASDVWGVDTTGQIRRWDGSNWLFV